jgi:hypothetical protein
MVLGPNNFPRDDAEAAEAPNKTLVAPSLDWLDI